MASWSLTHLCAGQEIISNVQQGTNMALALAPDGQTIVIDLVGQLWRLPVTGGAARPLMPVGEPTRNPRFSPSGDRLVYQRSTGGQWDVWLLDRASGVERQLTGPPFDEREPEFSADGESLLYASDRTGRFDIWEHRIDSGELRQLSRSVGNASFPAISDRGDIVYVNQHDTLWALNILQPDGSSLAVLESPYPLRAPSWRPGGGLILYSEQRGPNSNDLNMILLSDEPVVKTLTEDEDVFGFRPAWLSPGEYLYTADGQIWRRKLAIPTRSPVLLFAGIGVTQANHSLRVSGHAPAGIQRARGIRAARDSSSGRYRAFTALGDLWLQDTEGELRRLTNDVHLDIDPDFSPSENALIFASDRAGDMDLWQLSLETNEIAQLTNGQGKSYQPAVSPDGTRVAFLRTTGFGPWSESSLELLSLVSGQQARMLASDLVNARALIWDSDSNGIAVATSRPPASAGNVRGAGWTHVDLRDGSLRWRAHGEATTLQLETDADLQPPVPTIDWTPALEEHHYVVQVDRLFDGVRNQYRRHMDIHVKNGRITDVVARGLVPLPDVVIDALDYTIIPGLIDVHAHQSALSGERLGRIWMAYGVTTVREVGGTHDDGMERRESWASGKRLGPRLLLTSSEAESSNANGENGDLGYDILELNSGRPDRFLESRLEEAITTGLPIFSDRLMPAARFGINGLEHIGSLSEQPYGLERSLLNKTYQDVLSILTQTRTVVTPTLTAFGGMPTTQRIWSADAAYTELYHTYERSGWRDSGVDRDALPELKRTVAELVRAGGRITTGSDSPIVPYGLGLHAELTLLSEAGLANDQVLRLATADAALALGLERDLGTLESGKLADFIVLSGDPLLRITDTLRIKATVKDGVWRERRDLLAPP
jgi:Tol biopolymer transport system component